jgi:hypothetical protein
MRALEGKPEDRLLAKKESKNALPRRYSLDDSTPDYIVWEPFIKKEGQSKTLTGCDFCP